MDQGIVPKIQESVLTWITGSHGPNWCTYWYCRKWVFSSQVAQHDWLWGRKSLLRRSCSSCMTWNPRQLSVLLSLLSVCFPLSFRQGPSSPGDQLAIWITLFQLTKSPQNVIEGIKGFLGVPLSEINTSSFMFNITEVWSVFIALILLKATFSLSNRSFFFFFSIGVVFLQLCHLIGRPFCGTV